MDAGEALAEEEKKRLLDSTSGLDRIILLLLFDTGLKIEDLIETRISDIDFQEGAIVSRSSGKKAKVSPQALAEIKSYVSSMPSQSHLLEGRCGKPVTAKWTRCVLEKRMKRRNKCSIQRGP